MQERNFENITKQIGATVLLFRLRCGYSQFLLGIEVQMSTNQIGRIERGETNPTVLTLSKLAIALKVDIEEFFMKKNNKDFQQMLDEITQLQGSNNKEKS